MAVERKFKMSRADATVPPSHAFVITPDSELESVTRVFWVGTDGDLEVTFEGQDTPIVLPNVRSGVWHPGYIKAVHSANTTATDILGGY